MSEPIIELDERASDADEPSRPRDILRGVSLAIRARASRLAIVGPSGSGKTSLADGHGGARAGDGRPDCGRRARSGLSRRRARGDARRQHRHRLPVVSPRADHDGAGERGAADGVRRQADAFATARALLQKSALRPSRRSFSGAAFRRRAAARRHRARAQPARRSIILADEPTGNLDGKTGEQMIDLLFGLQRRREATLVLVTHDEKLAARTDRVIRMADGRSSPTKTKGCQPVRCPRDAATEAI